MDIHELIIPSTVLIEVAIVMSRAVGEEIAKTVYERVKKHHPEIKAYLLREVDIHEFSIHDR